MKAMIFAAGLGTRLKPITDTMPKALVPVCGHFPDQIIHYLHSHDFGARIAVSDERDFLRETGGGIKYARPLLLNEGIPGCPSTSSGTTGNDGSEPFLVHNVDIVSNLDLGWLREQHREGALVTLVASERKTQRYFLFDEDNRLKGWTNIATGEVRSPFGDIDPDGCRKLAFAGIHLMSPAIFDAFDRYGFGDRFSIVDFYLRACADYPIYAAVPPDFQLVDVGKFDALPEAEATCAKILND